MQRVTKVKVFKDDWGIFGKIAWVKKEEGNAYIVTLEDDVIAGLPYTLKISKNDVEVVE